MPRVRRFRTIRRHVVDSAELLAVVFASDARLLINTLRRKPPGMANTLRSLGDMPPLRGSTLPYALMEDVAAVVERLDRRRSTLDDIARFSHAEHAGAAVLFGAWRRRLPHWIRPNASPAVDHQIVREVADALGEPVEDGLRRNRS